MAVVAVWKCDRDGAMFDNKKEAEEHDKMLELALNITCLIEKHLEIDEKTSEAIGILLAEKRDKLAIACKGKPNVLLEDNDDKNAEGKNELNKKDVNKDDSIKDKAEVSESQDSHKDATVTAIAANQ